MGFTQSSRSKSDLNCNLNGTFALYVAGSWVQIPLGLTGTTFFSCLCDLLWLLPPKRHALSGIRDPPAIYLV